MAGESSWQSLGRPQRILVAGASGSGKSTLAADISARLGLPYTEIDALFHGPNWVPRVHFVRDISSIAEGESWVTEWQYEGARELLAGRAELMVWLDFPWPVQMSRVVRRTVRRRWSGEELWNGNREAGLWTLFTDPEHVVRWAWRTRHKQRGLLQRIASEHPHLEVVRLGRPRDAARWVRDLA